MQKRWLQRRIKEEVRPLWPSFRGKYKSLVQQSGSVGTCREVVVTMSGVFLTVILRTDDGFAVIQLVPALHPWVARLVFPELFEENC